MRFEGRERQHRTLHRGYHTCITDLPLGSRFSATYISINWITIPSPGQLLLVEWKYVAILKWNHNHLPTPQLNIDLNVNIWHKSKCSKLFLSAVVNLAQKIYNSVSNERQLTLLIPTHVTLNYFPVHLSSSVNQLVQPSLSLLTQVVGSSCNISRTWDITSFGCALSMPPKILEMEDFITFMATAAKGWDLQE